jgi:hypothetical protein
LFEMDEEDLARPVNSDIVKRYYVWCIQFLPNQ